MKKAISLFLTLLFTFGMFATFSYEAIAVKKLKRNKIVLKLKKQKKIKKHITYGKYKRYRSLKKQRTKHRLRKKFSTYQEYLLSPRVKAEDQPAVVESLKDKGVSLVRFDRVNNSVALQFSSLKLSAVDIIKTLKGLGYTVVGIN